MGSSVSHIQVKGVIFMVTLTCPCSLLFPPFLLLLSYQPFISCSLKDVLCPFPLCLLYPHTSLKRKETSVHINLLAEASRAGSQVGIGPRRAASRHGVGGDLDVSPLPLPSLPECPYPTTCSGSLKILGCLARTGCCLAFR